MKVANFVAIISTFVNVLCPKYSVSLARFESLPFLILPRHAMKQHEWCQAWISASQFEVSVTFESQTLYNFPYLSDAKLTDLSEAALLFLGKESRRG